MSLTNIKSKIQSERGFTIVELLIVVVVIAILAAITIVSYNGITRSANASSAKSTAATTAKKIEAYQAEVGAYPATANLLTADTSKSYYITAGAASNSIILAGTTSPFAFSASGLTSNDGKGTVVVRKCMAGTPANQAAITAPTGMEIRIWDYENAAGATTNGVIQAVLGTNTGTVGATATTTTCPAI